MFFVKVKCIFKHRLKVKDKGLCQMQYNFRMHKFEYRFEDVEQNELNKTF